MPEETKQPESLPPEIYDVVRTLITAIRIIKLYPPNNPVYTRTLKDSHEALSRFLEKKPDCFFGVEKLFLTYMNTPLGKDTEANKTIVQDMFTKGIREINFSKGLKEEELLSLFQSLALSKEEIAMRCGISSLLWEKGVTKIKVTEAELDGIIKAVDDKGEDAESRIKRTASRGTMASTRMLVIDDLMTDPVDFSSDLLELAKKTKGENETVKDRLMVLYQEAARKIQEEHPGENDALFLALAQSVLALAQPYRDELISGLLYADMDSENIEKQKTDFEEQLPNRLHEILTGRFSNECSVQQMAAILKKLMAGEKSPSDASSSLVSFSSTPDLDQIIKEISQYTAEEMEEIKAMNEAGTESDVLDAAIRTLIALLPFVKNPHHETPDDNEIALFSGVVRQLEEILFTLIKKQDYKRVSVITNAFNSPVDPAFKPRMLEALKKTSSKDFLISLINDLQNHSKDSSEYISTYSYLSSMEQESTEVLLELLASDNTTETTPKVRAIIIELLKDIGKNQVSVIGDYLHDDRWFLVSSIINILSEIKSDEAVVQLQKLVSNKNVKIRQEVIKGLLSIGGERAAVTLSMFFKDGDDAVQMAAIRGLGELKGIKPSDTKPLITYLNGRSLNKKDLPLILEAIKALEKKGGPAAEEVLKTYTSFRWWKSWSLQKELKTAALKAMGEIKRRKGNGGSAKR
jgi:hypothetical protein